MLAGVMATDATPDTPRETQPGTPPGARAASRATVFVRGHVQGVGFRWWTRARALELGLVGHARNTDDGRVEVVAQGSPEAIESLVELLREEPSTTRRPGRVTAVSAPLVSQPRPDVSGFVER